MAISYVALKAELLNDPLTYGYATPIANGDDIAVAALINKLRNGTDGEAAITVRKPDVRSKDIWESIAVADFPSLSANPNATQLSTERRSLSWMEGLANIPTIRLLNDDGSDTPVIANLQAMFPAGSGTRNRLIALAQRVGSRAEQLFGPDVRVTSDDVATALRQTP